MSMSDVICPESIYGDNVKNNSDTSNINVKFITACAYYDTKIIVECLENKIVPTIDHFYLMMTAFVGYKIMVHNASCYYIDKIGNNCIDKSKTLKNIVVGQKYSYSGYSSYSDFYFKWYGDELFEILCMFNRNGLMFDKQIYKTLSFFNIPTDELYTCFQLTDSEMKQIDDKYKNVYKKYVISIKKIKKKILKIKKNVKTQAPFVTLFTNGALYDILQAKKLNKTLMITNECILNAMENSHTQVFEYLYCLGYVPSIESILFHPRLETQFLLMERFYSNNAHDANKKNMIDLSELNNRFTQNVNNAQSPPLMNNDAKPKKRIITKKVTIQQLDKPVKINESRKVNEIILPKNIAEFSDDTLSENSDDSDDSDDSN